MLYIKATNLTKSYTTKPLFKNIDFTISSGQKIALVAKNGAGKTTLLKAITGTLDLTDGVVEVKKGLKIGYLSQSNEFNGDSLVNDVLFDIDEPNIQLIKKYETLLSQDNSNPELLDSVLEQITQSNAWEYEHRIKTIISKLKIDKCLNQKISSLSGGEVKRLALAKVLVQNPDMLVLDEPTNHLDLTMIEWLENYFKQLDMTLFIVTHDRYFLERVCNEIWELDRGMLNKFEGNYSYYLQKKLEREQMDQISLHKLKRLYKNELARINRAPSGRGTKSVYREQRFDQIKQKYDQDKDRMFQESFELEIGVGERKLGSKVLIAKNINKTFGDKIILKDFSHEFKHHERIGIIGDNGVGKSTFINILMGNIPIDSGNLQIGKTIMFGHYHQKDIQFPNGKRIIDVVRDIAEFVVWGKNEKIYATDLLTRFLFPQTCWYMEANALSGGEKRRLHLLCILMQSPNFLILDEPTNDLDLVTIGVLEEFLMGYSGCLIIVSHDRFFMDKLVDHIFVFSGNGKIQDFWGTYSEYRHSQTSQQNKEKQLQKDIKSKLEAAVPNKSTKLTYMEKREFDQLEPLILQLEEEKQILEKEFLRTDLTYEQIEQYSKQMANVQKQLEEKEARWLELSEKI